MDPDRFSLLTGVPTSTAEPTLTVFGPAGRTEAIVLVLHGGRARSTQPTRTGQLAYRRMVSIARNLHAALRAEQTAIWLLRNRVRGWNEPSQDAVADANWALTELALRHPDVPILLVGHSMGARAALRVAGWPTVVGVCALAPWLAPDEEVGQLAGRTVLIAHGDRDRWTDPRQSFDYACRAREHARAICRFEVTGSGHAMLRRAADWTALTNGFVAGALGIHEQLPVISRAMAAPVPEGLCGRLPTGLTA
ncbi:MAG TPA: alpha/beta fold hydrolase [Pseudonocardiaceae bacterium]|jgi:dienelactone hydrolase|nr:alpha/beta fold hydrolase [Pseudonocardiaceae bacterium]